MSPGTFVIASQSFAPQGEIKSKSILSGGFADLKNTARLASVEFCPIGAKLCAQSRRSSFAKKPLLFGSVSSRNL